MRSTDAHHLIGAAELGVRPINFMTITEQLRILGIFHYVVGGLHALFGCFGFIHLSIGIAFMTNPHAFDAHSADSPPAWFGAIFALAGGLVILFGWSLGFLTILSGRFISKRTRRTFSIVMGGINCALFPFGTVLGVFDVLILTKDETKRLYEVEQGAAANP
jgi:hypothetical protein